MEKRRIIVDYKNITSSQLSLITDRYPEGFAPEDMMSFKNSKGVTVRAVPLETEDTKYLFKISIEMERRMEAHMDEDDSVSEVGTAPDEVVAMVQEDSTDEDEAADEDEASGEDEGPEED
ncbi:MAG: hypothetical protein EXR22_02520 [Flavobacteriaceae bacterium]|nr:hypothetical protein [Flavobacteriaceae bacterium]PHX83478.1 MAG: hypothetical protein CK537_05620 [Flavobacteriales bacterium]